MPYDIHWHDEAYTIVRLDAQDKVSWREWHEVVTKLTKALAKVPYRLDFIFNDTVGMPAGNPLPHITLTMKQFRRCANLGLVVVVSSYCKSTCVKAFLGVLMHSVPIDWNHAPNFVTTLNDAMALIAQDRAEQNIAP